jgi:hypothetical protein
MIGAGKADPAQSGRGFSKKIMLDQHDPEKCVAVFR